MSFPTVPPTIGAPIANPTFIGVITLKGTGAGTPVALSGLAYQAYGTVTSWFQSNIQNLSNNVAASTDHIVTADTGTDSVNYGDFGINSSAYSQGTWTISGALDVYLYSQSTVLTVGTATAGKNLIFHTGGTLAANARLTLSDTLATHTTATTGPSFAQTVQQVAVSTTPAFNLASGNTCVLGASGVPGALTADTTFTFSNPVVGSTTSLFFQQGATAYAITFTIAGYTFYINGTTAAIASGATLYSAGSFTISQFYTIDITWLSATTASVALLKQ